MASFVRCSPPVYNTVGMTTLTPAESASDSASDIHDGPTFDPAHWIERHGDTLFRYAFSRLRSREAAEEVVQETFLAGLKHADQYSGEGVEGAWLMGILRRKVIDYVRKRRRVQNEAEDQTDFAGQLFDEAGSWKSDPRFGERPSAESERVEFYRRLDDCLEKLPERQASAFTLRELEELDTEEICEILDVSPSNLSVLLYRARMKLSGCLASYVGQTAREPVIDG